MGSVGEIGLTVQTGVVAGVGNNIAVGKLVGRAGNPPAGDGVTALSVLLGIGVPGEVGVTLFDEDATGLQPTRAIIINNPMKNWNGMFFTNVSSLSNPNRMTPFESKVFQRRPNGGQINSTTN